MPSLYSRILTYEKKYNKVPIPIDRRQELGITVSVYYRAQKEIKLKTGRVLSKEPEGDFLVVSYPRKFIPEIDKIILVLFVDIPTKKERKRIPAKGR